MKCKTGKRLIRKWSTQIRNANMSNWQQVMFGKREYDLHAKRCKTCGRKKK